MSPNLQKPKKFSPNLNRKSRDVSAKNQIEKNELTVDVSLITFEY